MLNVHYVLVAAMCCAVGGCRETRKPRGSDAPGSRDPAKSFRYVFNPQAGWAARLTVNGQPAVSHSGKASLGADVTHFVINGRNAITIEAERVGAKTSPCDIRFGRMATSDGSDWEVLGGIDEKRPNSDRLVTAFEFSATSGHWPWQDGDDLGPLTNRDKKEMLGYLERAAEKLRSRERAAVLSIEDDAVPLRAARPSEAAKAEVLEYILKCDDYVVVATRPDDIQFDRGTKLVRVYAKQGNLLSAGPSPDYRPPNGELVYSWSSWQVLFMKQRGQWVPLK